MAVLKKCTSLLKKCSHKNIWKIKAFWAALNAFSLAKSLSIGNSKSYFVRQTNNQVLK
ncbi:hypothetical protein Sjap_018013 [Stephania japonica]|uniref:Ribosomal protein L32 n=1 Tax=Stephania japonica TaxID=461633 RepID=A0AAP0I7E0_9MAGN